jgi:hypothetical protein
MGGWVYPICNSARRRHQVTDEFSISHSLIQRCSINCSRTNGSSLMIYCASSRLAAASVTPTPTASPVRELIGLLTTVVPPSARQTRLRPIPQAGMRPDYHNDGTDCVARVAAPNAPARQNAHPFVALPPCAYKQTSTEVSDVGREQQGQYLPRVSPA